MMLIAAYDCSAVFLLFVFNLYVKTSDGLLRSKIIIRLSLKRGAYHMQAGDNFALGNNGPCRS